jgi:transcriptional regulator with GAF, ATPase, and Fis domain
VRDLTETARGLWEETHTEALLSRLCKSLTFMVGASAAVVSRVDGPHLVDVVTHSLREVDIGDDSAYVISEFPITEEVLGNGRARSVSFLDEEIDFAEAFVLRELRMSCVLMVPLIVKAQAWGLVEIYDVRLRQFSSADQAIGEFLVSQAGLRLETIADAELDPSRPIPVWRLPASEANPPG